MPSSGNPYREIVRRLVLGLGAEELPWQAYPCLLATVKPQASGYAYMKLADGSMVRVHRFAWSLVKGPIPEGLGVLHHCDTPLCFRPSHLFLGTTADNMADMVAKGRQGDRGRPGRPKEYANGMSKITKEHVAEIRMAYAGGLVRQVDLAVRYGVNQTQISAIVRGASWRVT